MSLQPSSDLERDRQSQSLPDLRVSRYGGQMTPDLSTFSSQRLTLSLAAWGDKSAPPVILVHGGRDQKRSWDWTAKRLAERYRVYAYDLRGHGQSEWVNDGDYGVMDHVFDLASLVEHIGAETVRIVSHSLGGNIAIRYTGLFPEKVTKLVAIEGWGLARKCWRSGARSNQKIECSAGWKTDKRKQNVCRGS